MMPPQPYSPGPAFGGMKAPVGFAAVTQFAVLNEEIPARMNATMTASLTATMTLLTFADSLIPTTRRAVDAMMMITAGALIRASVRAQWPLAGSNENGAPANAAGIWM